MSEVLTLKENTTVTLSQQNIENAFTFNTNEVNSVIEVKQNGDFYYKGNLVTNDIEVYERFKEFLANASK